MSELTEERARSLADKLRSTLNETLREGWNHSRNPARKQIVYLFGIIHADDLDGLDLGDMVVIAAMAGLPAPKTDGRLIREGRDLAPFVDPKAENPPMAADMQETRKELDNLTELADAVDDAREAQSALLHAIIDNIPIREKPILNALRIIRDMLNLLESPDDDGLTHIKFVERRNDLDAYLNALSEDE